MWTVIVAQKIKNQASLLEFYGLEEALMLDSYVEELEFNDVTNREGHAAKVYFNAMFGKSFTRSDDIPINAALNYGYSMFNQFNLSCDLMEPFRPFVDNLVKNMSPKSFDKNEKQMLISLLNKDIIVDGRTNTMINAIKIYCKSIFSAIEENDILLIKFPTMNYEL